MAMIFLILVANFFAGAFLCNAVPHLVSGLQGRPFPTPFARPRGVGLSSPFVNFVWGFANLVVGLLLLAYLPVGWRLGISFVCFLLGILLMGLFLSRHFGRVMATRDVR